MQQKTKRIVRATFFTLAIMSMPLLIVGCQKEDLGTENPTNQKSKTYEETFTLENFDDPYIKDNVMIDWNAYRSDETDSVTVYEFNVKLKEKQFIENGDQQFYTLYKLLVTEDGENKVNLQLLKFFTDDKENLDQVDYFNTESFSGTLYYYGLDGRNTKIAVYEDGEVISEFEDKGHGAITEQSKAPVAYCEDCPEGGYVLVLTEHYTDYYVSWNGGEFTYSYSVYMGTTSEWVWVPGTGGSGGGSINPTSHSHYDYPHGPSVGTNNHVDENIVQLYNSMDKECQSGFIINFTANINSEIISLFKNAFFPNNNYNAQFEDENLGNDILAATVPQFGTISPDDIGVRIIFDNDFLETSTNLAIVTASAHEYVHSYLIYLYAQGELLNQYPEFTEINNALSNYETNPTSQNLSLIGETMHGEGVFDNFIGMIAEAVYAYVVMEGIEGANEEYCYELVLGFHQYTEAFQNLTPEEQSQYSQIAINEQNGNQDSKGTVCNE